MTRNRVWLAAITAMAAMVMAGPARADEAGLMVPAALLFEYDSEQPLSPELELLSETPQFNHYYLKYTTTAGLRVTGWYYTPGRGKSPYPVVIFLHGSGGSKQDYKEMYMFFAIRGYAVLALDTALHGDRRSEWLHPMRTDWYQLRNMFIQTVVDLRRAVDWIETKPELDPGRIGYLGISQGTLIGVPFVAVEPRVSAAVFLIGGADYGVILEHSLLPGINLMRNYAPDELARIAEALAVVDPMNYIGAISPRPVMIMNGTRDSLITRQGGERLQALAGEPKETYMYEGDHMPPIEQAMMRAVTFMGKWLKAQDEAAPPPVELGPEAVAGLLVEVDRDFSEPENRIVTITARGVEPLPEGAVPAVNFPNVAANNFPLFDDGTRGDETAGDGVYALRLELGPFAPDLFLIGGEERLYQALARIIDPYGNVLWEEALGVVTAED